MTKAHNFIEETTRSELKILQHYVCLVKEHLETTYVIKNSHFPVLFHSCQKKFPDMTSRLIYATDYVPISCHSKSQWPLITKAFHDH